MRRASGFTQRLSRALTMLTALSCIGWALAYAVSEETPVGSVRGEVFLAENNKPMAGVEITLQPIGATGYGPGAHMRYAVSGQDGSFSLAHVPAGYYEITAIAHSHDSHDA